MTRPKMYAEALLALDGLGVEHAEVESPVEGFRLVYAKNAFWSVDYENGDCRRADVHDLCALGALLDEVMRCHRRLLRDIREATAICRAFVAYVETHR